MNRNRGGGGVEGGRCWMQATVEAKADKRKEREGEEEEKDM